MNNERAGTAMPHGWVEDILMDVMLYCTKNGLDTVAYAIEPALVAANALSLPPATHEGAPNTTQ